MGLPLRVAAIGGCARYQPCPCGAWVSSFCASTISATSSSGAWATSRFELYSAK